MRSLFVLAAFSFAAPAVAAPSIRVEMVNRFRILQNETQERIFRDDLRQRIECIRGDNDFNLMPPNCQAGTKRFRPGFNVNYLTRWQAGSWTYGNYVNALERDMRLSVRGVKDATCTWSVTTDAAQSAAPVDEQGSCDRAIAHFKLGTDRKAVSRVQVTVKQADTSFQLTAPSVTLRDVVIATLGDSFISGEGNPHLYRRLPNVNPDDKSGYRSQWLDLRCHRSLFSSPGLAAWQLSRAVERTSVTYVPLACSGAEIHEGVVTDNYIGRETPLQAASTDADTESGWLPIGNGEVFERPPGCIVTVTTAGCNLPAQVDVLKRALQAEEAAIRPDLLVVSSGGNELGFGSMVSDAAHNAPLNRQQRIREIRRRLTKLTKAYKDLAGHVDAIKPAAVAVIGYLDPTRRGNGANSYCDDHNPGSEDRTFLPTWVTLAGFGIDRKWARFAHDEILVRLNDQLSKIAQPRHWSFLKVEDSVTATRGYCAPAHMSWFYTFDSANANQGTISLDNLNGSKIGGVPSGAMHPNVLGHSAMAAKILAVMKSRKLTDF
jgi:hypothetical protein